MGLLVRLLLCSALGCASGTATTNDRSKLVRDFNASLARCTLGSEGVIVELVEAPASTRRRLGGAEPTRAEQYLEKLAQQLPPHLRRSRSLSQLLMVHGTFSTLLDGFAASLDDAMLNTVLNDTDEASRGSDPRPARRTTASCVSSLPR
jgi:hypothetical protein